MPTPNEALSAYRNAIDKFAADARAALASGTRPSAAHLSILQVDLQKLQNLERAFAVAARQLGEDFHWAELAHAFFVGTCSSYLTDLKNPANDQIKLFDRLLANLGGFNRRKRIDNLIAFAEPYDRATQENRSVVA